MKKINEFRPLIKFVKEDIKKIIFASSIIFLSGICEIFTGYLNGQVVESITKLEIKRALINLGIYFVLEITMNGFIFQKAKSILYKEESKLTRKLGFNTYKKALNLPAVSYEKTSSGEIINRITNDADTLSFAFGHILDTISSLVASFIVLIYIFINSSIVGIEILVIVTILFFVLKEYNKLLKKVHRERKEKQDNFTSLTNETIRGIREIKTLGIKNNLINNMISIIKDIYNKSSNEIDINRKFNNRINFLKSVLECTVFATCVVLLYYDKINLSFFIAMTYYVYRYTWLIESINNLTQTYQKVSVSISRVNDILENRLYEDEKFGTKEIENIKGVIEFKNVTFAYPNEDNILSGFDLKLEPNKKIAIVGASGHGKSTLFNLLTRIFDANSGEILIDGINIKDLEEDDLRKNVSIIRQEAFVFNRSIKENFKLIDDKITLDKIRKYTKMAYLDDYIMSLPKKYDTILGEGGVNLSGGQKQRLSIARTLSKGSKIILFDEATSALDNLSQEYIKKAIDNLVKNHTVVIVAHRLSTIKDADIIHVVENGKVIKSGKHDELLKICKTYKNLYETESLNS